MALAARAEALNADHAAADSGADSRRRFVAAGTFPRFLKAASERMRSLRQRSKQLLGARTE